MNEDEIAFAISIDRGLLYLSQLDEDSNPIGQVCLGSATVGTIDLLLTALSNVRVAVASEAFHSPTHIH